jgi:hypothetical protein
MTYPLRSPRSVSARWQGLKCRWTWHLVWPVCEFFCFETEAGPKGERSVLANSPGKIKVDGTRL